MSRELQLWVTEYLAYGLPIPDERTLTPYTLMNTCSYKISLWAARHASKLFKDANVPFSRPNDYYAEMLKSDEHMEKIRQKLLDETANIKASEQAKKQRHLKKFGKQVQVEKQKEREKAKKDMNDKVKSFRKSESNYT